MTISYKRSKNSLLRIDLVYGKWDFRSETDVIKFKTKEFVMILANGGNTVWLLYSESPEFIRLAIHTFAAKHMPSAGYIDTYTQLFKALHANLLQNYQTHGALYGSYF